jgi:hypothetical protein
MVALGMSVFGRLHQNCRFYLLMYPQHDVISRVAKICGAFLADGV